MRAVCLLIVAGLVLLCRPAPAQAQLPPRIAVRLEYEPIPGMDCPSADDLHNYLMAQLGYDPIVETATSTLVVRLRKQGKVFEADSFVRGADGTDLWHEPPIHNDMDCWEIAQDAARAVRIGLGPSAWPNRTPPEWLAAVPAPAPAPEPTPPPSAPRSTVLQPVRMQKPASRMPVARRYKVLQGIDVAAGVSGAVLATPSPGALGGDLEAMARFGWGSVGFEFRGLIGIPVPEDVLVSSSLWTGTTSLCLSEWLPKGLSLCGLASAVWMHTSIDKPDYVEHGDKLFPAAGLRVMYDFSWPGRSWFLRGKMEASIRLRQLTGAVEEAGKIRTYWSSKPIVPVLGLDLVRRFD
jgi:hypothetical protein